MSENKTVYSKILDRLSFFKKDSSHSAPGLIKANSYEELQKKKEEVKQKKFLQKQFIKVNQNSEIQAINFESGRMAAYYDFEAMEYYPTISKALDVLAEESTTTGDNGDVLNISSDQPRVEQALKSLFYDVLDVNHNLFSWCRNMLKYGDNFIYLRIDPSYGIIQAKQLPTIQIVRRETIDEETGKNVIKFLHQQANNEYTNFQIAHFRLITDDKFLPYGMSVLNKIRVTWLHLIQMEDAMSVYRLSRASERRVWKINVGNIDDDDVEAHMNFVSNNVKKTPHVEKDTGNIAYRYNSVPVDQDIFLPIRSNNDGTTVETLAGASNLDQIADIQYQRDNLYTGLGVPKSMLNFSGDQPQGGKNFAMEDIRLARSVNRFQQALLQELNKMAIIHLYLLGYEDDLFNFRLTLNNPSTQSEILRLESLSTKVDIYQALVDSSRGAAAMSESKAKALIFGMSPAEILHDMQQQMVERVVADELNNASKLIGSSQVFDELIKKYKVKNLNSDIGTLPDSNNEETNEGTGDDINSTDTGGGLEDIDTGMDDELAGMAPGGDLPMEGLYIKNKILTENVKQLLNETEELL